MLSSNYRVTDEAVWQGRIDSESDYEAYRWHQWIKNIDLSKDNIPKFTGKLGFAFLGFCCDKGVYLNKGRAGAAKGPNSIRKELANLPCTFTQKVKIFDAGNIYCDNISLEEGQDLLSHAIDKILDLNLFPIVLGGGHEIAFGHYRGVLDYLKRRQTKPSIGIINFDAHFDLRPYPNGGSSGTMFRQIADICKDEELDYAYFCLGLQKHSNTVKLFRTADELDVKYILAKDIIDSHDFSIIEKLDNFIKQRDCIYMTICSDVFSSSFAPGVSAAQPLGLDPEKVLKLIKYILRTDKVISFDIAEVSPRFDQDRTTANLAAVLIFSVVNTLSEMNKLSI